MSKDKKPTGPEPERLKLEGDWMDAIAYALKKKKPAGGWPKPPGRYRTKKARKK